MANPYGPPPAEDVMEPGSFVELVLYPRFARLIAEHRQEAST
jgi:hypothetical protein|tara:strand:- start:146 stop:271 length:126 start_codon:yes stop_codon:yes gene_type:complete